jgi:hypothetical protein
MKELISSQTLGFYRLLFLFCEGIADYSRAFAEPFMIALEAFIKREKEKLFQNLPMQNFLDFIEFVLFNVQIGEAGINGTRDNLYKFCKNEQRRFMDALCNCMFWQKGEKLYEYFLNLERDLENLFVVSPKEVCDIRSESGFHFDDGGYKKIVETARFIVYQIFSRDKKVKVKKGGKPILIMHPYVLGPNILAILPGEKRSYVHAFADQGIPTYVRILKDIRTTPAVQVMTGEDDAQDTRIICEKLMAIHGRKVTLNGFCQGGFMALLDILSGELDGLVDALITCVAPMDGTRSKSLKEYMEHLPPRFRDLAYAVKTLPNGNSVVDGKEMSWVYKLKSMREEAPLARLYEDLLKIRQNGGQGKVSKLALAMNNWLIYDRGDLPEAITKLSFDSYTIPVTEDGTLPVKMFGKTLNYQGIPERGIKWLLCYGENDDLVDSASALSPTEYIDGIEVTPFPKGHGAIATTWTDPETGCSIDKCFKGLRGPVRFQMDLDEEVDSREIQEAA